MDTVISASNVGKCYTIRHQVQKRNDTLRDEIVDSAKILARKIFQQNKHKNLPSKEKFWALKDISFDIKQGERVGIIGKNGAGKSTLLKILSRITEPTTGKIRITGRVASLLEVGTGFHPELTGRENVFLNGAILGMTRSDIIKRFDEIVAFAEVEKFLDTPVKRYSSGMYVRLAFAVAAHLEPEILIVDEVLAVGDYQFQKKCLGKMEDVGKEGRTVLFVSHNMAAVKNLCQDVILLQKGFIKHRGLADTIINLYLKSDFGTKAKRRWDDITKAPGNDIVRLIEVKAHTEGGNISDNFDITRQIGITMDYEILQDGHIFTHACSLYNGQGVYILSSHDVVSPIRNEPRKKGTCSATIWIPGNFFAEGIVFVWISILRQNPFFIHFYEPDVIAFNVTDKIRGDSARGDYVSGDFPGVVRPLLKWETKNL